MKKTLRTTFIGSGLALLCALPPAPAKAQLPLPDLIPPIELAGGVFTAGSDQNGIAVKASAAVNVIGDHGVAASAFFLSGDDMRFYALTGEYRRRFGPFSVGYWALGGGIGSSDGDQATMDDGAVWTAGLGAQLSAVSVEGRALSSFGGGSVAGMLLVGLRF